MANSTVRTEVRMCDAESKVAFGFFYVDEVRAGFHTNDDHNIEVWNGNWGPLTQVQWNRVMAAANELAEKLPWVCTAGLE